MRIQIDYLKSVLRILLITPTILFNLYHSPLVKAHNFDNFNKAVQLARSAAQHIQSEEEKRKFFISLSVVTAKAGEIHEALHIVKDINPEPFRFWALKMIGIVQTQKGDFGGAKKRAEEIGGINNYEIFWEIGKVKHQMGDYTGAWIALKKSRREIEQIKHWHSRDENLYHLVKTFVEFLNFPEARETVGLIDDGGFRYSALSRIAKGLAQIGQIQEALGTAFTIRDELRQSFAFEGIAKYLWIAGNVSEARNVIDLSRLDYRKTHVLPEIAEALFQMGDSIAAMSVMESAIETAIQIKQSDERDLTISNIVHYLGETKKFEKAIEVAYLIDDKGEFERTLFSLAQKQGESGFINDAINTAQKIIDHTMRSVTLIELSRIIAEDGNPRMAIEMATPLEDIPPNIIVAPNKYRAYTEIASAFARKNHVQEALNTVRKIPTTDRFIGWRAFGYQEIARIQVINNNLQYPPEWIEALNSPLEKASAFLGMAMGLSPKSCEKN